MTGKQSLISRKSWIEWPTHCISALALHRAWYEVRGDGPPYRVELRTDAGAYERSVFNGDELKRQRDVESAIGLIYRSPDSHLLFPQRVVDAFNSEQRDIR